jgi:GNAT superfamily N-acetyltransferase
MSEASGRIRIITWRLAMQARPTTAPRALPEAARVEHVRALPLHFYRYLYETVGAPWAWVDRRWMGDAELASHVQHKEVEVHVGTLEGVPFGFFELDARTPGSIELAYFGLMPEFVGRGVGLALLEAAVARAWDWAGSLGNVSRVWVHTCSLDHPRALEVYRRAGFTVFETEEHEEWDPRPLPISPR